MQICLVRPRYDSHLITPPLGMGYISSYLKSQGHNVNIVDGLNLDYSNEEIVEKCEGADFVGIFCLSAYYLQVIDLSKKLKDKGYTVIIGGPHASALPEKTLKDTGADYIVVGEGEEAFLEIIQKKPKSEIIKKEFIQDLDKLPFPDWEQLNPKKYKKAPHGALIKYFPVAPIVSTRGCPFECTFCASPQLWHRKIRFRSPENVVDEIQYLVDNFGVKEIHFEDDNLTLKREHVEKICNLIIERNLKISWACPNGVRADTLDSDLLKLMKKSGCYYLAFGCESGNQQILNNIKKKITLGTLNTAITTAEKEGIMTQGFFIFGLPGETEETIKQTIEFARKSNLSRAQFLLLDVLPGSELWLKLDFNSKWDKKSYQEVTWCPPNLDKAVLDTASTRAFKSFFFRPKQMWSLIKYFKVEQLPFILKRMIDFKILGGKSK